MSLLAREYSGGTNTEHLNIKHIQNLNVLKIRFAMVLLLNGWSTCTCLCDGLTIPKPNQYIGIQDGGHFDLFLNCQLLGFRMAFKYRTIQHTNYSDHQKFKHFQYSNLHCIVIF